ncbi:MAG: hypothetical protein HY791_01240 [Deltaproteobacteria bacterium]|nr:hypothetical protein [Deltaproteobacteria bacterium]
MSTIRIVPSMPFPGWDAFRGNLAALDPFRVLAYLLGVSQSEVKATGAFQGNPLHNPMNHGPFCRILLRQILDQPSSISATVKALSAKELERVSTALAELNGLIEEEGNRDHDPSLAAHSVELTSQIARDGWRRHLATAGRSRVMKCEVARIWLLLREYWPRARARAGKKDKVIPNLHDPLVSAFDSMEYVLALYVSMHCSEFAFVVEPERYFKQTDLADKLRQAFELYVPQASEVVGTWAEIEAQTPFPHRNPFRQEPLLRIDDRVLLSPDPGILFSGIEGRLIKRAVRAASATTAIKADSLLEGANTLLGKMYEDYVRDLLDDLAKDTGETYLPEFALSNRNDSPDAILRNGPSILFFECKARGLPTIVQQPAPLDDLLSQISVLAGIRDDKPPFAQLSRFFDAWRGGDEEACSQLGRFEAGKRRCLVVSPDNLPNVTYWRLFRDQMVATTLDKSGKEAERLVEFVSIYDLEILCAALRLTNNKPRTLSAFELVERWRTCNRRESSFFLNKKADKVKLSLGDYLLTNHPGINDVSLTRSKIALDEVFKSAGATLFQGR